MLISVLSVIAPWSLCPASVKSTVWTHTAQRIARIMGDLMYFFFGIAGEILLKIYYLIMNSVKLPGLCILHASQISSSPETMYPHRWQVVKGEAICLIFVAIIKLSYHTSSRNANFANTFFSLQ